MRALAWHRKGDMRCDTVPGPKIEHPRDAIIKVTACAMCCRNFGTVSIVGVHGGYVDKIPMGSAINRGLTFRMAQTPVQRYLEPLLHRIATGEIDPSFVITHRGKLEDGPDLYRTFRDKKDGFEPVSRLGRFPPAARARSGSTVRQRVKS